MADMYDRFRAMTIRNLKPRSQGGKGMEGVLQSISTVYDEDTDMNVQTKTPTAISGIRASYKQRHIDGTLIRQGDVKFYMCPVLVDGSPATVPKTADQLEYDGDVYSIITVKKWRHTGIECGWLLQLRAA